MTSSQHPEDVRFRGKKSPSAERNSGSVDDTDAPSVSPFSLSFFKVGLPPTGYMMLFTEIIPSFTYLALSHFHIGADESDASLWFNNHFYAVLFAIPASFMIAILSDGYTYGKFVACIIMQTMMFITGLCSLLETFTGLSPSTVWLVNHLSPYSIFVYYVTLPIRVTIFTDVFAKHRTHERARKAFTAYWVCNLTGFTLLLSVYQHYFEKNNTLINVGLLVLLLSLNFLYFLVTCMILMALPLELPLKNQFLYHMNCLWYAVRHKPPKSKTRKKRDWLEPALEKYTQTEVKRSRSLAQLLMLVIPEIGYACGHSYIYYNWYNYGHQFKWFGPMTYAYSCFYGHMVFTVMFIAVVEVIVLPIMYHCWGHFKGIWLFVTGYFLMGIPLSTFVGIESSCSRQNTTRYNAPSVRLINGYPDRILLYSDWLGPDGGKGRASIAPGDVLTIRPPFGADGRYGEATILEYPSIKVTDFLAMTVVQGHSSTYFLSPFHNQHLELRDYDVRRSPEMVLYGAFQPRKGTAIISCSPDFYSLELDLKCSYDYRGEVIEMPPQHLCTTRSIHNGVAMETRPILTVLNWPARTYLCSIADEILEVIMEVDDFAALHLASRVDPETKPKVARQLTFHHLGGIRSQEAYLIVTNLDILHCQIPYGLLILQVVVHSLSSALVLVSGYTIHCLHGPPRMRMTSYALPHIGCYIGVCIERCLLNSKITPIAEAIVFEIVWFIGFVVLTLIAIYCRFEFHSWDIPRRPPIFWKLRAWLNIRLHHRSVMKDKAPKMTDEGSPSRSGKGILQHDIMKDKTIDDDKSSRKVTFIEE